MAQLQTLRNSKELRYFLASQGVKFEKGLSGKLLLHNVTSQQLFDLGGKFKLNRMKTFLLSLKEKV